ncbi:MAG: FliI/YscN family ATPase, partial [Gammaproteobacteria bacterium]|nr:FliI/YscN family ATPase [Gammaproteobacteria bacterium]
MNTSARDARTVSTLEALQSCIKVPGPSVEGKLCRASGLTLEAEGCHASVGTCCRIVSDTHKVNTEVVGFSGERLFLMPVDRIEGLKPGARVIPTGRHFNVPVGDALLGRIIDGNGQPLDQRGPLGASGNRSLHARPMNPLHRTVINTPLDVGVRAINALLPIGRGQRIGLMAGSGVGKSQLLAMMTRHCEADVVVIGLIGERGREVKSFIEDTLGADGMRRTCVVAVPADNTALRRLHGAMSATTIAEYFRDQGKHVLLLMDSLTRYAQAQREIGLAIGEPPTTKGYPPSVFQSLPQLVERAGVGSSGGSVTAIYTVLAENDDQGDPVVDAARAVLDGHIVLSRTIAESGIYPAIDIEASLSRLVNDLAEPQQLHSIALFRELHSAYTQNSDLINLGLYQHGSNPVIDKAIHAWPRLGNFMRQGLSDTVTRIEAIDTLSAIA